MPTLEQLLGPAGALVLTLAIVGALWRSHLQSDADVKAQRDGAYADLRAQVAASNAGAQSQTALAEQVGELTVEVAAAVKGIAAIRRDGRRKP